MDCMKEKNKRTMCSCTASCSLHGQCCACVRNHAKSGEFPACFFSKEAEATYDRSFSALQRDRT